VTKEALVAAAAAKAGLPKKQVAAALGALLDSIAESLAAGEQVKLPGFGTFEIRQRAARKARDFRGGVIEIPPGRRIVFRPFAGLRRAV